jgi:hypothetical protein
VAVKFTTKKSVLVFLCAGISACCNQLETAFEKLKLPNGVEHIISYLCKESLKYVMVGGLCLLQLLGKYGVYNITGKIWCIYHYSFAVFVLV